MQASFRWNKLQLLTLLTTPVVYVLLDGLRRRAPDERHLSRAAAA
jgi:multidrug efflux pump